MATLAGLFYRRQTIARPKYVRGDLACNLFRQSFVALYAVVPPPNGH
jgi:hypothetical protein